MALEKAIIINTVSGERIELLINPEEYSVKESNNFAQTAVPGLSAPILQFVNGGSTSLDMELLADTYEARGGLPAGADVREVTGRITGLLDIDPTTHAPPILLFTWGTWELTCVLASVSSRFIMFRADGVPVRARLQLSFTEFRNIELEAKQIKRETADYSSRYVVGQGETLSTIAWRSYNDATLWRPIALMNGIDDPRELVAGMQLLVPHLPYRDPATGELFE